MNLIVGLCNYFCSRPEVFGHVGVHVMWWQSIYQRSCRCLIFSLQLLLRKRHLQKRFLVSFAKSLIIIFFIEQLRVTASVTSTLLKSNVYFITYFSPKFVTFQIFYHKVNKFSIVGKLLPSGVSLYTFSLKVQSGFFVTLDSF